MQSFDKPNIVLIVIDSLRSDHVSCYGYPKQTTPNIDEISRDSVMFGSAISPSGWTLPVFASIFTGTYPSKNGNGQSVDKLPTIMDVLRRQGYQTFGVTANDFVEPLCSGFEDFVYLKRRAVEHMVLSEDRGAVLGLAGLVLKQKSILNIETTANSYLKNRVTKRWLNRNHAKAPFFVMLHYDAHWPYKPPRPFFNRFVHSSLKSQVKGIRRDVYDLIGEQEVGKWTEVLKSLYDAQIAWVDSCIGNLVDYLKSIGVFDNTLLIITSDHGDLFGEHNLLFHELVLYEPLLKVPLIVRFPNLYRKGKIHSGLVQTIDIFPMLNDYLRIDSAEASREIQGKSLLKFMEKEDEREFTISERSDWASVTNAGKVAELEAKYPNFDWRKYAHEIVALRTNEYKYIWSSEGRNELYDLSHDPQEMNNLISTEKTKAAELSGKLETWKASFVPAKQSTVERELESSVKEKLRRLGYL